MDIKAFVELHIEQGCLLESNGQSIGVVNAIVGQRRYTVTLNGESNHAGTTPMGYRRDTVYAFSRICPQSIEKAKMMGDPLVLTFGKVEPRPNTVNVVPGKTTFTIDCRHTDAAVESNHAGTTPMGYRRDTVYAFSRICQQSIEKAKKMGDPLVLTFGNVEPRPNTVNVGPGKTTFTIDCRQTDAAVLRDFTHQLENDMRAICDEMDIGIDLDLWMDEEPVPMNKELVATLTELCESEKLNYRVMHSGAGQCTVVPGTTRKFSRLACRPA